jgi:hypothetical protein
MLKKNIKLSFVRVSLLCDGCFDFYHTESSCCCQSNFLLISLYLPTSLPSVPLFSGLCARYKQLILLYTAAERREIYKYYIQIKHTVKVFVIEDKEAVYNPPPESVVITFNSRARLRSEIHRPSFRLSAQLTDAL